MESEDIRRYSLDDLKQMRERGDYVSTYADAPEYEPDEEFWKNARIVFPDEERSMPPHLLDNEVVEWFRAQGPEWQKRMNAVLRSYIRAQKNRHTET